MIEELIDGLKAACNSAGLGGDGNEYKIITQAFMYKFLNDKFTITIQKLAKTDNVLEIDNNKYQEILLNRLDANVPALQKHQLLESLLTKVNQPDFADIFDSTLFEIASQNNDIFSVHTVEGTDIRLFDQNLVKNIVHDETNRSGFCKAIVSKLCEKKFDEEIFSKGFDFFSVIFEYLLGDYNANSGGVYAEYYTPHSVAEIMAKILVGEDKPQSVSCYDPSAGTGSLLMSLAHQIGTDKCTVYSQDISQKSSSLLRLNLILNSLVHSISNIRQGNTILNNAFVNQKFDFITSNPPFKLDFSSWQMQLPVPSERFFAGVPNIKPKAKDKMAIYLLFIQHIMHSLSDKGKAAIVVPTGFITAQNGIEKKIRKRLVENGWLKGVVSMPSNIFANTGTNVSVIFIDKHAGDKVILVDASKLGRTVREDGSNQKTVLNRADEEAIINAFKQTEAVENLSIILNKEQIKEKNYSLAAGQYFPIKIDYAKITADQFAGKMQEHQNKLADLFKEGNALDQQILDNFTKLKFKEVRKQ